MTYALTHAIDVLDALATGERPSQPAVVRGAIALALHCTAGTETSKALEMLRALEHLALDTQSTFDDHQKEVAGRLASQLRRTVGVH